MAYPGRQNIYESAIRRMVSQALEAEEERFALEHGSDTDEQLLAYLRECAYRLHHSPWPREIPGGKLIEKRFGTWKTALMRARLPANSTPNQYDSFTRVYEETERQKEIYRVKKTEKKQRAQQKRIEQTLKKKQPG